MPLIVLGQQAEVIPSTPQLSPDQQEVYDSVLNFINQSDPTINSNTGLPSGFEESLSVNIFPESPGPNENVSISLESFSINLKTSNISWTQDGVSIASGLGITNVIIQTPSEGSNTVIVVRIAKATGGISERTITITPAAVSLIYEALTYTPPFYKGGAVFTRESSARFTALTNFIKPGVGKINPNQLLYTWQVNDYVIEELSGVGRNVLEYPGALVQRGMDVSVEVSSIDGVLTGADEIFIDIEEPKVLMYEKNPLYGPLFEKAVSGQFMMERDEISLIAVPYFFDARTSGDSSLDFNWFVNGREAQTLLGRELTLRNETGEEGLATVSLVTEQIDHILQSAQTGVILQLGGGTDFQF